MKKPIIAIMSLLIATPLAFADGAELYGKKCASCHGADGKGQTTMGKKKGARDYTDATVQGSFSDADGVKAVLDGVTKDGKELMKGNAGKITEAEAKELIQHIRTFKK